MRVWAGCWLGLPGSLSLGVAKWVRNLAGFDVSPWKLFPWFCEASCSGLFWWCVNDALTQSLFHYYTGFFSTVLSYNHYCFSLFCVVL